MTTKPKTFTREELESLTPSQIEEAVKASDTSLVATLETDPANLGQLIHKVDPLTGVEINQAGNSQILIDAGVWPVYDRRTGVMSIVLKNLLPAKLVERDAQGQLVYTTDRNEAPPVHVPQYPCLLHIDHAMFPRASALGFTSCKKMLRTANDALNHSKKHRGAWDTFQREDLEAKEARTQEWQDSSIVAQKSMAASLSANAAVPSQYEKACIGCGESVFASNEEAAQVRLDVHLRGCEPYIDYEKFYGRQPEAPKPTIISDFLGGIEFDGNTDSVELVPEPPLGACESCDFVAKGKTDQGTKISLNYHVRKEHPDD